MRCPWATNDYLGTGGDQDRDGCIVGVRPRPVLKGPQFLRKRPYMEIPIVPRLAYTQSYRDLYLNFTLSIQMPTKVFLITNKPQPI